MVSGVGVGVGAGVSDSHITHKLYRLTSFSKPEKTLHGTGYTRLLFLLYIKREVSIARGQVLRFRLCRRWRWHAPMFLLVLSNSKDEKACYTERARQPLRQAENIYLRPQYTWHTPNTHLYITEYTQSWLSVYGYRYCKHASSLQ